MVQVKKKNGMPFWHLWVWHQSFPPTSTWNSHSLGRSPEISIIASMDVWAIPWIYPVDPRIPVTNGGLAWQFVDPKNVSAIWWWRGIRILRPGGVIYNQAMPNLKTVKNDYFVFLWRLKMGVSVSRNANHLTTESQPAGREARPKPSEWSARTSKKKEKQWCKM